MMGTELALFNNYPMAFHVIIIIVGAASVVMISWLLFIVCKQWKVLDKTMAETLSEALGSEDSPLVAEAYALMQHSNKKSVKVPCFLGLANTRLLLVLLNMVYTPAQIYTFPFTELSSCSYEKSHIPNQYILTMRIGENIFKFRLYKKIKKLENQSENVNILLSELRKYK